MKIKSKIALVVTALSLTACGAFTNLPAQVKVGSIPNGASVKYTVNANSVSAEVTNPKITLHGEAGSIGVTYDIIEIEYLPTNLPLTPRTVAINGSIRVPSSHQLDDNGNAIKGSVEFTLPVISSHIQNLGSPSSQNRISSQITAKIKLTGVDDAGFPSELKLSVPINFTTASSSTAAG